MISKDNIYTLYVWVYFNTNQRFKIKTTLIPCPPSQSIILLRLDDFFLFDVQNMIKKKKIEKNYIIPLEFKCL